MLATFHALWWTSTNFPSTWALAPQILLRMCCRCCSYCWLIAGYSVPCSGAAHWQIIKRKENRNHKRDAFHYPDCRLQSHRANDSQHRVEKVAADNLSDDRTTMQCKRRTTIKLVWPCTPVVGRNRTKRSHPKCFSGISWEIIPSSYRTSSSAWLL